MSGYAILDIMMNPEILTTLGVGIANIAVVLPVILYLSGRIDETNKRIDETNRSMAEYAKEINRSMVEYAKETSKRFDETSKRIDETNRSMAEYAKETNKRFDETNKRFDEVNRRVDEQSREQAAFREDVVGRMGRLEGLLEGLRELIINKRAA